MKFPKSKIVTVILLSAAGAFLFAGVGVQFFGKMEAGRIAMELRAGQRGMNAESPGSMDHHVFTTVERSFLRASQRLALAGAGCIVMAGFVHGVHLAVSQYHGRTRGSGES
jgi:hypothetical protein